MVLVQFSYRNSKGNEVVKMVITFLPLFLFGALRVGCGDYEIYESYNSWVRTTSGNINDVIERMEPGYTLLNKWLPYRWIIIITSFLTCYAYSVLFVRLVPQKYRWFGIVLFFLVADKTFYFMFSSIRNSISISVLLIFLSYRVAHRERNRSFIREILVLVVITAVAYLFHASALMFYPIAFFATVDKEMSKTELYAWIAALVFLWVIPVGEIIDNNWIIQTKYFSRYDDYVEETNEAGLMARIGSSILAILCLTYIHKYNKEGIECGISRLMLVFVYSYMLGSLNMRVSQYFIPFAIVFLSNICSNRKIGMLPVTLMSFAILFLIYSSFFAGTFADSTFSPFVQYKIFQ